MDKKNKSLIDDHEHGIILNESGTSVSFGWDAGESEGDKNESLGQVDKAKSSSEPPTDNTDIRLTS